MIKVSKKKGEYFNGKKYGKNDEYFKNGKWSSKENIIMAIN